MNSHLLPYPYNRPQARQFPGLRRLAKLLYDTPGRLYCPPSPQLGVAPICVVCIADTHNATPEVPDGDLLIHAGDLTQKGTFEELDAQIKWLSSLPHTHKVVIAGNHDCLLDPAFVDRSRSRLSDNEQQSASDLQCKDIHYLQNSSVVLSFRNGRNLRIFGSPLTPEYGTWAFQYPAIRDAWTGKIPEDANIVITHSPPALHCDAGKGGDGYLLRELRRCKPLLAVCGHAHDGYGEEMLLHDGMQAALDNVLLQAEGPFGIFKALFWMNVAMMRSGIRRPTQATRLVNAALAPGSPRKEKKVPIVVDL